MSLIVMRKTKFMVDLKLAVPLLLNVYLWYRFSEETESVGLAGNLHPVLPVIGFFVMLWVSIKFPLTLSVSVDPILLRIGDLDFSYLLTLTLLASFLCPPYVFLSFYILCIFAFTCFPRRRRCLFLPVDLIFSCFQRTIGHQETTAREAEPEGTHSPDQPEEPESNQVDNYLMMSDQLNFEQEHFETIHGHA